MSLFQKIKKKYFFLEKIRTLTKNQYFPKSCYRFEKNLKQNWWAKIMPVLGRRLVGSRVNLKFVVTLRAHNIFRNIGFSGVARLYRKLSGGHFKKKVTICWENTLVITAWAQFHELVYNRKLLCFGGNQPNRLTEISRILFCLLEQFCP